MRLLVLGTGGMANSHAEALRRHRGRRDGRRRRCRPGPRRRALPSKHGIAARFTSLDEAIAWGEFDAVTNVTPDRVHHPTTLALLDGRQARVLRKAAGGKLCQGDGDDRGGRSRRPRQHGQPDLSQCRAAAEGARDGAGGRDRHGQAMSRRPTCRAGWSPRPGATGAPRASGCGGCRPEHGSNGVLGDIGIHILDFAAYGAGSDIDHVFAG